MVKSENGGMNSKKLVSTEQPGENSLCTYLKCVCADAGAPVQLTAQTTLSGHVHVHWVQIWVSEGGID